MAVRLDVVLVRSGALRYQSSGVQGSFLAMDIMSTRFAERSQSCKMQM